MEHISKTLNEVLPTKSTSQSPTRRSFDYTDKDKQLFFAVAMQVFSERGGISESEALGRFELWWSLIRADEWTLEEWKIAANFVLRSVPYGKNVLYAEFYTLYLKYKGEKS